MIKLVQFARRVRLLLIPNEVCPMKKPMLQGAAFLDDVVAARQNPAALHLWWLGQSGFLVQWQGRHLLLDPYLSDSLTRKYAQTDKPHVRMTERVVDPGDLDFIDVVTSSHSHTDHLDAETLLPIMAANPGLQMVVPAANRAVVAERLGCDPDWPLTLDDGEEVEVAGFRIFAVPAAHEQIERDKQGRCKYLGYVVSCLEAGTHQVAWTIYHSGDTMRYQGMIETLLRLRIDVALLPINGSAPERRVAGNLDGRQAAELAHAIGAKLAVPCHYDMFAFNTATPDLFIATCERLRQAYAVFESGERRSLG
jgi:L-ascorbate metabolism protein UlaG (beta-lactamase superfamily)